MKTSAIGWTDYSGGGLNFVSGCTPVSEGCEHCYARAIYERFGRDHSVVTYDSEKRRRALSSRAYADYSPKRGLSHKAMCFVCDMGDLLHEQVPDDFILDTFDHMGARRDVTWQILTKRPGRMRDLARTWCMQACAPLSKNIWLGVTAENQARADERIPILLDTPAAVRFVSVEPMLTPVSLEQYMAADGVDWIICGAESGPRRRPFDVAWAEALYQQCQAAGAPFFFKQGSHVRSGMHAVLPEFGVVQQWPEG